MSEARKPALTPDEWEEFLTLGHAVDETERLMRINRRRREMADDALNARRYDAAAALALYDQPFGFTWEDVDTLLAIVAERRRMAETALSSVDSYDPPITPQGRMEMRSMISRMHETADQLDAIAARIAALLPPRDAAGGTRSSRPGSA